MLDENLIKRKIRNVQEYSSEIQYILDLKEKEISENIEKLKTLERNFQLIVDTIIDINVHFIRNLELASPDDFQGTFIILGEKSILPRKFAEKIAPVVGLRNRLVHGYESVDKNIFVSSFKRNQKDFDKYIEIINEYL